MPRLPRLSPPGMPVHVVQRGNNRNVCFTCDADKAAYVKWLAEGAEQFEVSVHAWALMSNHTHLLATPTVSNGISRLMQSLGRRYVKYFNFNYGRTGTLFEGRFRSTLVEADNHLLNCIRYIELNPVRAGIVSDPGAFNWSSYAAHAYGTDISLWTPHVLYLSLGDTAEARQEHYRSLVREHLDDDVITRIRQCTNSGLPLGSEPFRKHVSTLRTTPSSPDSGT